MPRYKRYSDSIASAPQKICEIEGCSAIGEHKAPKSVYNLRDYYWLCIEHVREYNKSWDYFTGLKQEQIEAFMKDAVTGHRPTWKREEQFTFTPEMLHDALNQFLNGREKFQENAKTKHLPQKEREALGELELDAPCNVQELKTHYRKLVKLYHPDTKPGDKPLEERFKRMTAAYAYLSGQYSL